VLFLDLEGEGEVGEKTCCVYEEIVEVIPTLTSSREVLEGKLVMIVGICREEWVDVRCERLEADELSRWRTNISPPVDCQLSHGQLIETSNLNLRHPSCWRSMFWMRYKEVVE
jgi:hypothetical protein